MGVVTHTQVFTFVSALMAMTFTYIFIMGLSWWHERQARARKRNAR